MSRQLVGRIASIAGVVVLVALLAVVGKAWWDSRIPGTYSVMSYGTHDYGGGAVTPNHEAHGVSGTSVADLHGPTEGAPDERFELTAQAAAVHLSSGRIVHALTFDGTSPGPELRVQQGDLVEVVLRNLDVDVGVTIHWHGVDVPNAEDGVAGVTQNAVLPGESYTYRFRADQVGTFWYHTHQVSSEEVQRGLFGALVIEPSSRPSGGVDRVLDECGLADAGLAEHDDRSAVPATGLGQHLIEDVALGLPPKQHRPHVRMAPRTVESREPTVTRAASRLRVSRMRRTGAHPDDGHAGSDG